MGLDDGGGLKKKDILINITEKIPKTKPTIIPNLRSVCSIPQPTKGSRRTKNKDTKVGVSEYTELRISEGTKLTN